MYFAIRELISIVYSISNTITKVVKVVVGIVKSYRPFLTKEECRTIVIKLVYSKNNIITSNIYNIIYN